MKKICAVSHPRSGVHWILNTIFKNFRTPYDEYWQMFGGHRFDINVLRKQRPNAKILHVSRDIQPVLMSVFRMRERNGISMQLNFSDFLRTKYKDMQRTSKKTTKILFDNRMTTQAATSWISNQPYTPPELWLATNMYWRNLGIVTVTYEEMKVNQNAVLDVVSNITGWKSKKLSIITQTVGWHPQNNKPFEVCVDDQKLIGEFSEKFSQGVDR